MYAGLLPLLACPTCAGGLSIVPGGGERAGAAAPGGWIDEAALACTAGHAWRVERGVPRLLAGGDAPRDVAATRRAFERQWRHYGRLRRLFGKDRATMRGNLVGGRLGSRIDARWYAGKRVLDAGCGHGRYLAAFASLGAEAVGVDVGDGPDAIGAAPGEPRVHVVRGDVLRLPLSSGAFDLAFCDGVLHHTADPKRGFLELARVVRPGGAVHVWLYPREGPAREAFFGAARAVTTRMPGSALRGLCLAAAPLTAGVRSYSRTKFPTATWGECAQVVHDWLAPPLQSHHTYEEIEAWAAEAGLVDAERHPIPVGLTAWRPYGV